MLLPHKYQENKNYHTDTLPEADQVDIVYYTDPLCCWSWGFEPQWRKLRFEFSGKINWRYCMGGLIPSWNNYHDPLQVVSRPIQMGPVWLEASHLTGMPIYNRIWRDDPPASSYPACIAAKCAGLQSFRAGEIYLRLLREAVMLEGKNIASLTILAQLADELAEQVPGFDPQRFHSDLHNDNGLEAFRKDLNEIQSLNIGRFPSLILRKRQMPSIMITGYRPYSVLQEVLQKVAPAIHKVQKATDASAYTAYWGNTTSREIQEALS